jgi:hypothetical protein
VRAEPETGAKSVAISQCARSRRARVRRDQAARPDRRCRPQRPRARLGDPHQRHGLRPAEGTDLMMAKNYMAGAAGVLVQGIVSSVSAKFGA